MNTVLAIVFYAVLPVLFLLAVILWVIYVHDDFDGHGRAAWRWLTGRARGDHMRSVHLRFQAAIMAENWARAVEIADSDTEGYLWPGLKAVARRRRDEAGVHEEWSEHYAVTTAVLSDDFYVNAGRAVIDTLHDSTMMAPIDKGEQAEADMAQALWEWRPPWIPPDPYLWHDVADLIDRARL